MRIFATALVCVSAFAQQHSWQQDCFDHPGLPYCQGRDFAVKQKPQKDTSPRSVVSNPFSPRTTRAGAAPSMMDLGSIDWRFADPFPDVLIGFNMSTLSASPLAHKLISQLAARQGLTDADVQRIFESLSAVDQVALSVRANRLVMMATGPITDLPMPAPEAGLKAVQTPGAALLFGHTEAVDQASRRLTMKVQPAELAQLATQLQGTGEFWAVGTAALLGPQAMSAGVRRFSMRVSITDGFAADVALEFAGAPNPAILRQMQGATIEGNLVHMRMAIPASQVQQSFAPFAASPAGAQLASLVKAARFLPPRAAAAHSARPVIYGLDDGPKEVGQDSNSN